MKALIWKEFREIGLWATLIAAGLLGTEAFALHSALGVLAPNLQLNNAGNIGNVIDSAYGFFKLWLQIGAPVGAALLGAMQIVPEQRRDQWSFLLHRPVTPRTIFFAKSIAGIGLYLLATAIPLLIVTAWLQAPGHFPGPFDISLTFPDIAAILSGIPFYFAAMMVALRPARWWGSKLLPAVCAGVCVFVCGAINTFGQAVALAIITGLATLLGAWGCFESHGEYDAIGKAQRAGLGLTLMVGAISAALFAASLIAASTWHPVFTPPQKGIIFALDSENRLVQLEEPMGSNNITNVFDSSGSPLIHASRNVNDYKFGSAYPQFSEGNSYTPPGYASYENHAMELVNQGYSNKSFDFYDYDRSVIDIYSSDDARLAGFLGTRGVVASTPEAAGEFQERLRDQAGLDFSGFTLLIFPHAIYSVNVSTEQISRFATMPGGGPITDVYHCLVQGPRVSYSQSECFLVESSNRATLFTHDGSSVMSFPIPSARRQYGIDSVWIEPNYSNVHILYKLSLGGSQAYYRAHPDHYVTLDKAGNEISDTPANPVVEPGYSQRPSAPDLRPIALVPVAAVLVGIPVSLFVESANGQPWGQDTMGLLHNPALGSMIGWICLGALISALLMLAISRLYGWNKLDTARWIIGGALLSWPGILMLLAMVRLPVRVVCPSCGRKRLAERLTCEHCGASMQPKPDGTEIFEGVEAEPARHGVR